MERVTLILLYENHNHQLATAPLDQTMGIYWFELPPELDGMAIDDTMNMVAE
jgi:hypothetical protein